MSKESQGERALAHKDVLDRAWPAQGPMTMTRGRLVVVFDERPELVEDREGNVVGIDAMVRAFRGATEVRIDPHRRFINPPTWHAGKYDPLGAYEEILFQSIVSTPAPRGWRTRGTVSTFFSDAADGYVDSDHVTYSTCRAGASLSATVTGSIQVGQDTGYNIYEGFVSFDTSSIADTDQVSAATLSLYCTYRDSNSRTLRVALKDWGATLTTADWVAGADLGALTEVANKVFSTFTTSAYNDFTSQAAFPGGINLAGFTYLLLYQSGHADNSAPTDSEFVVFSSANQAGTTQDPKLTVTHSSGITGTSATTSLAAGVGVVAAHVQTAPVGVATDHQLSANPGVVSTVRGANISGESATLALEAEPGSILPSALFAGASAQMTLAAGAGSVQALVDAVIAGVSSLVALGSNPGLVSTPPPTRGTVEVGLRTTRVRTRQRSPSVTLGLRKR